MFKRKKKRLAALMAVVLMLSLVSDTYLTQAEDGSSASQEVLTESADADEAVQVQAGSDSDADAKDGSAQSVSAANTDADAAGSTDSGAEDADPEEDASAGDEAYEGAGDTGDAVPDTASETSNEHTSDAVSDESVDTSADSSAKEADGVQAAAPAAESSAAAGTEAAAADSLYAGTISEVAAADSLYAGTVSEEAAAASDGDTAYDEDSHIASVTADSGTTYYTSLSAAYDAAESGAAIQLLSDISMSTVLTITKAITLDLNGKTISVSVGKAFTVNSADASLTIKDTSSGGGGTISATSGNVIYLMAGSATLSGGTVTASTGYTVNLIATAKTTDGASFTMTGGTIANSKSTGTPLLLSYGTAVISGGTIKNTTGASYGVNVNGANVKLTVGTTGSSGYTESSDPYINYLKLSKNTTGENVNLYSGLIAALSGGSYLSSSATLTAYFGANTETLASGLSWSAVSGTSYYKIEGGLSEDTAAAKITDSDSSTAYYASAVSAAAAAAAGDTVTLLQDYAGSDALAFTVGNVTLDLNGHSVTVSGENTSAISFRISVVSDADTVSVKNSSDTQAVVKSSAARIYAYANSTTDPLQIVIDGDNISFASTDNTDAAGTLSLSGGMRIAYSDTAAGYVWNGGLKAVDSSGNSWIYGTYKEAIALDADAEVTLLGDWTADETIVTGSYSGTLDLGGYTITSTVDAADSVTNSDSFIIYAGNNAGPSLTVKNGAITNSGSITYGIYVAKDGSSLTLDDVDLTVVLSGSSGAGIVTEGTTLNNAVTLQNSTNLKVTDTSGDSAGVGIYFPSTGTLTISDSSITAYGSGVEIRAGSLVISGDNTAITATASEFSESANGSGSTVNGAAVVVSQHTTNYETSASISGGTFTGYYALYEKDLQDTNVSDISLKITDGTFVSTAQSASIPAVYSQNCTAFIYHGVFTSGASADADASYLAQTGINGGAVTAVTANGSTQVHALTQTAASAAACEEDGNLAYSTCTWCGDLYTADDTTGVTVYTQVTQADIVVAATGHDYDDGVVTTAATCTTDGVLTYTCKNDSSHTYTEAIAATGHTWNTTPDSETWEQTESGYTVTFVYSCSNCGTTKTVTQSVEFSSSSSGTDSDSDSDSDSEVTYTITSESKTAANGDTYTIYTAVITIGSVSYTSQTTAVYSVTEGTAQTVSSEDTLTVTGSGTAAQFTGLTIDGVTVDASYYTLDETTGEITVSNEYLATLDAGNHTLTLVYADGTASTSFTVEETSAETGESADETEDAAGTADETEDESAEESSDADEDADGYTDDEDADGDDTSDDDSDSDDTSDDSTDTLTKTGDSTGIGLWVVLLIAAAAAAVIVLAVSAVRMPRKSKRKTHRRRRR